MSGPEDTSVPSNGCGPGELGPAEPGPAELDPAGFGGGAAAWIVEVTGSAAAAWLVGVSACLQPL